MQIITVDMYQHSRECLAEGIYKLLMDFGSAYADNIPSPEAIRRIRRFGDILRDIREDKGLSQEMLGERLAVSRMGISRLELGQKLPGEPRHVLTIAKALDCDQRETADLLRSFTIDRLHVIVSDLDTLGGLDAEEN
ncbi:MAG TPA: helix-turn-helix transcriptional regulator [Aggregatilineales bacterium]|nr:helix-turn-helix transcriptional regulator [Aggregatilineales bacterium]